MLAALAGNTGLCSLLLRHGADITASTVVSSSSQLSSPAPLRMHRKADVVWTGRVENGVLGRIAGMPGWRRTGGLLS